MERKQGNRESKGQANIQPFIQETVPSVAISTDPLELFSPLFTPDIATLCWRPTGKSHGRPIAQRRPRYTIRPVSAQHLNLMVGPLLREGPGTPYVLFQHNINY